MELVLDHVRQWDRSLHTPQSAFYLFVLLSLLGFGTSTKSGIQSLEYFKCIFNDESSVNQTSSAACIAMKSQHTFINVMGQWAGPLDLSGKNDSSTLPVSLSYT